MLQMRIIKKDKTLPGQNSSHNITWENQKLTLKAPHSIIRFANH